MKDSSGDTILSSESREIQSRSGDRYTKIRTERVNPSEIGAGFKVETSLGITVYTDSEELSEQVEKTFPIVEKVTQTREIVYLTKNLIAPIDDSELQPRPIDVGSLGDLCVDKTLSQYTISGPVKLGSLESIMFGIKSFDDLENDKLGLHASLIYDKRNDVNHIIIGASGTGKSTLAQFLENSHPERFIVLADDWVEIDSSVKHVGPVSTTFGYRQGTLVASLVRDNSRIEGEFESFGKTFAPHEGAGEFSDKIGSIFILSDEGIEPFDDFSQSNRHIPFLTQFQSEFEFLTPQVQARLIKLRNIYRTILKDRNTVVLGNQKIDINRRVFQVLNIVE